MACVYHPTDGLEVGDGRGAASPPQPSYEGRAAREVPAGGPGAQEGQGRPSSSAWLPRRRRALAGARAGDLDVPELFQSRVHLEAAREAGSRAFFETARDRYALEGMPTSSDKAGDREQVAKRLGALVDGSAGVIGPDGDRIAKLLGMTNF